MLYKTLLKLKERNGLTDDLKNKIDVCGVVVAVTETRVNRFGLNDYYVFRNDKAVKRDRERRFG